MRRRIRNRAGIVAGLVLAAVLAGPARAPAQTDPVLTARVDALLDSASTHPVRARIPGWTAELERLRDTAALRGHARTRLRAIWALAYLRDESGDQQGRRALLMDGLALADSIGDGEDVCATLEHLAMAERQLGMGEAETAHLRALRARAGAIGSARWRAASDLQDGQRVLFQGRRAEAESLLNAALPVFAAVPVPRSEVLALQYLAIAAVEGGRPREARALFHRARDKARAFGHVETSFALLANLGAFEQRESRQEAALAAYAEMDSVIRLGTNPRRIAWSLERRAHVLVRLQRLREAVELADSASVLADRLGIPNIDAGCRLVSSWALNNRGSYSESNRRLRPLLARAIPVSPSVVLTAATQYMDNLIEVDSLAAALAAARHFLPLADSSSLDRSAYLRLRAGDACLEMGEPVRADSIYRSALRTIGNADFQLFLPEIRLGESRAARRQFQFARAAEALAAATANWQEYRRRSGNAAFRERLALIGAEIAGTVVAQGIAEDSSEAGVARAFTHAERLKGLSFRERVTGSFEDTLEASGARTAAEMQAVLEPGELFLDYRLSADGCGVFVLTRDRVRFVPIPGSARSLLRQVREWRRLVADPEAIGKGSGVATRAVATKLLGGVAPDLRSASRLLIAPERSLYLVPFDLLAAEAAFGGELEDVPPSAIVPSATLLAAARRPRETEPPAAIFAAAGAERDEPGSPALPGPRAEVRWLADHFKRVCAVTDPAMSCEYGWSEAGVVHLAGHMRSDDGAPWNSAVRIALDGPEGPGELRAEQVAGMRIPARLVVLASCTSIGEAFAGEGLAGMATAFLIAGSPTVVATLWPVDDRATARFSRSLYDGLARGLTVGQAVRDARVRLRRVPRYHDEAYWAGYVIVGDPATRIALRRRVPWVPIAVGAGVALILALVLARGRAAAGRRRREFPPGAPHSGA